VVIQEEKECSMFAPKPNSCTEPGVSIVQVRAPKTEGHSKPRLSEMPQSQTKFLFRRRHQCLANCLGVFQTTGNIQSTIRRRSGAHASRLEQQHCRSNSGNHHPISAIHCYHLCCVRDLACVTGIGPTSSCRPIR